MNVNDSFAVGGLVSSGASAASGTAVAAGVLDTVNQYAPLIGIVLSMLSLFVAILFFAMSTRNSKREAELLRDLLAKRGESNEQKDENC